MAKVNASPKKKVQAKLNTSGKLTAPPADPSVNAPRKFSGFTGKKQDQVPYFCCTHSQDKKKYNVTTIAMDPRNVMNEPKCIASSFKFRSLLCPKGKFFSQLGDIKTEITKT